MASAAPRLRRRRLRVLLACSLHDAISAERLDPCGGVTRIASRPPRGRWRGERAGGLSFAIIPHPIAGNSDEALRDRLRRSTRVVRLLTSRSSGSHGSSLVPHARPLHPVATALWGYLARRRRPHAHVGDGPRHAVPAWVACGSASSGRRPTRRFAKRTTAMPRSPSMRCSNWASSSLERARRRSSRRPGTRRADRPRDRDPAGRYRRTPPRRGEGECSGWRRRPAAPRFRQCSTARA